MGCGTATGIVVVRAVEIFDIAIALIEMITKITSAVGTFEQSGKNTALRFGLWSFFAGAAHFLNLLPCHPVDNRLMDTQEYGAIFLCVLNPLFVLEGFGIGFEIDHITAVFL